MDPLEQLAAASRQQGGIEIPIEALAIGSLVMTAAGAIACREPASEVMRLREAAIEQIWGYMENGQSSEAAMVWVALTGPNGLPLYVDPDEIVAVQANREERDADQPQV